MTRRALAVAMCLFIVSALACRAPDPDSALHRAAYSGQIQKLQELVDKGADVNKVVDGETPLLRAAQGDNAEALSFLIENGADPGAKDPKGRDAWDLIRPYKDRSLQAREARCLAVLVEHGFQDRITLMEAARLADSAVLIKRLTDHGGNVRSVDKYGWTPLHWAAFEGNADSCLGLLDAGAEANVESSAEYSQTARDIDDGPTNYRFRYEKGSRPLDVASSRVSRVERSCTQVLKDFGATKNPKVKNKRRNR